MTAGSSNGLPLTFGAAGSAFVVILLKVALDVLMGDAADGFSLWVFIIYKLRKDTNAIIYVLQAFVFAWLAMDAALKCAFRWTLAGTFVPRYG